MISTFYRNAGIMACAELFARIKGLLILPLLTRYLGAVDYGVWSQVSMVVLTVTPLVTLCSENGMIRLLPGRPEQYRCFLAWVLMLAATAAVFAAAIGLGGGVFSRVFFGSPDYADFMPLAAMSLVAGLLPNVPRMWFRLQNAGAALALATVLQALLGIAAIAAALLMRADLYRVILLALLADLLLGAGLLLWIVTRHGWVRPDFSIIPGALAFGLPLLPAAYAMWCLNWMDRLFLVHYRTLHDIGIYAAAYGLGYTVIQVFVNPIWALYPNSAAQLHNQGEHAALDALLHTTVWSILIVSAPAIAGLWALGNPIITLVAGADFQPGADVMWIIALAYLAHMLASFGETALGLSFRQYLGTVAMVLSVIVNLVLNVLLIPRLGIIGAAIATLGGFTMQLVFSTGMALRFGSFLNEWRFILRALLAAGAMGLLVRALAGQLAFSSVATLALLVLAGVALYAALIVLLGAVPPPLLDNLRRWIGMRAGRSA